MGIVPRNIQDVLNHLKGVKRHNGYFIASCPVAGHETAERHLKVEDAGDKALVKCHSRHSYEAICRALGFDSFTYSHNGNKPTAETKTIEAIYDYKDAEGKLLFQVVRYKPKAFSQRRPDGNGDWIWNLKGIEPVLYQLPEIISSIAKGEPIFIVEGEKDADKLVKIGLQATTCPMGAGKWRAAYSEVLKGADVIILPDKDELGLKHADQVAQSLYSKVRGIKIVELPGLGKDVSDWLAAGGEKEELERIADETPRWEPIPYSQNKEGVSLVCMANVKAESVSWLWYPYIPLGKLTLLEGDPGIGKSWVSLAIATAVSLGYGLPDVEVTSPARVVLASAEDGLGDTIRPRLDVMKANVVNIQAIKGSLDFGNGGLAALQASIEQVRPAFVIVDPLVAYIGAGVDIYRANETRAVMAKLADMAEQYSVAILAVRHLTKGGTLKPIYRGMGSIDLAAACRSVLMAGCDPSNPQKRGIVQVKSNLAPMGKATGYELRDGGFYWTGNSDLTAARILAIGDTGEDKSARDEAADFIKDELADGPIEASLVWKDAREAGLSDVTVKRAKAMLGVITRRHGETGKRGGGKFTWELPDLEVQKDLGYQGDHTEKNDTLNNPNFEKDPLPKTDDTLNHPYLGKRRAEL